MMLTRLALPQRSPIPLIVLVYVLCSATLGHAAEIRVLISGGFAGAFSEMLPEFELVTGHRVIVTRGASMGTAAT
jgi:molybdate transport system substrate-binding protein